MRKFKIKNRRKRKYVKKSEQASSFSSVQSLTVGVIPLILMAIAFFATFFISQPFTSSQVTIPEVQFTWELPTLPEFQFPSLPIVPVMPILTLPDAPTITFPNIISPMSVGFTSIANGIDAITQTSIQGISVVGTNIFTLAEQIITFLDPRPALSALGQFTSNVFQYAGNTTTMILSSIGKSLTQAATFVRVITLASILAIGNTAINAVTFLDKLTIQISQTLAVWTSTTVKVAEDALNACIWFIGTPFRVLGAFFADVAIALTPFYNFLGASYDQSVNELSVGGETLMQGTSYFGETVSHKN